jgi:hypothetical protein
MDQNHGMSMEGVIELTDLQSNGLMELNNGGLMGNCTE